MARLSLPEVPGDVENEAFQIREGIICREGPQGTIRLHYVGRGKVLHVLDIAPAAIATLCSALLAAADQAARLKRYSPPTMMGQVFNGIPIPACKVGLVTNSTPGTETLVLQVGEAPIGFQIQHAGLGELGAALMAASAPPEQPN